MKYTYTNDGGRSENVAIVWQCLGEGVGGKGCWNVHEQFTRLKATVNGLQLLKYTCQDWRISFCTKNWGLLKRQILAIINNNIEHLEKTS